MSAEVFEALASCWRDQPAVAEKIAALVESLKREGFESMAPAKRRHLRDLCRYIANRADPDTPQPPKSGVLLELRTQHRDE